MKTFIVTIDTLRPEWNSPNFADSILCIFFKGNFVILIQISQKIVPTGLINNKSPVSHQ